MPVGAKQTLRFGPFELDPQCGQLRKNGMGLKLQGQPIQILEILLEKPGELVTREELRQRLWASDTFVDFDHSLNTAIKKLRQALGDEADTPRYIETLPKRGYRFICDVDREEPKEEPPAAAPPSAGEDSVERIVATFADPAISTSTAAKRRNRRSAAVAAVALLVVVTGGVIYWATRPPPMPHIVGTHALTKTGYRKAWRQSRVVTDGTMIYFQEERQSHISTMQVPVNGGQASELAVGGDIISLRDISRDGSELLLTISDPKTHSGAAWIHSLPTGPARLIVKDARYPVLTPDGRSILFGDRNERDLYRVNADGTDARRLATFPDIGGLAISPDGQHIRVGVAPTGALWEVDADGSNPHPILTQHKDSVAIGNWSPDGKYFFFLSWDGDRFNLWAASEERRWWMRNPPAARQLTFGPLWIGTPSLSKDGKHVFAVGKEPHGELSVYEPKSGKFVPYLSGISACYVDFSRDGQWIAYVSYPEGTLWRSRIDGSERAQLTVPPLAVVNPRWSPDGKLITFMELSGGDRRRLAHKSRIYVVSAEGGGPMLLLAGDRSMEDATSSPDGTAIAYGASGDSGGPLSEIRIFDLHTQKSTKVPGSETFWSPRWSPDGKYLAALTGVFPSKLVLFSFATQRWEKLSLDLAWPSWSRDSKFVYGSSGGSLVRIAVSDHKREQIASAVGFPITAYFFDRYGLGWFGLTPDGRPITTRDTGIEEVYAFDLEYK